jgi:hypothetical protein
MYVFLNCVKVISFCAVVRLFIKKTVGGISNRTQTLVDENNKVDMKANMQRTKQMVARMCDRVII